MYKAHYLRVASVFFCLVSCFVGFSEQFAYRYTDGDTYRILSRVFENVYVNRQFHHKAEIVNRISVKVTGTENTSGTHEATFVTSEKSVLAGSNTNGFSWGQEYQSVFSRDARGIYKISDEYFMPVVRNIPVFPDYDVQPGDVWSHNGEEAHDLRAGFNIQKPFIIPFKADYTYVGTEEVNGKTLHRIAAEYTLIFTSPKVPSEQTSTLSDYPVETMGYSKQSILWDNEAGMPVSYSESFRIILHLASGNDMEFTGTAEAELTEKTLNRTVAEKSVREEIDRLGVQNTTVTADDRGITISIENIQFKANSSQLRDSEKAKLDKIADILRHYPDNELLVTGHTALAGTPGARQQLSQERAAAVADYLVQKKVKEQHRIFSRGLGSEQPVADNSTPEGMARNRRVEITILEN